MIATASACFDSTDPFAPRPRSLFSLPSDPLQPVFLCPAQQLACKKTNEHPMKTRLLVTRGSALAVVLTPLVVAQSVTPPPPAVPPPSQDQPIILESVTVNTDMDRGYIAVDSLAGGRTNTPIKLTPAAMSSLTRTFLDDLGIQNVRDALRWSPNVVPSDVNAGKGFGGSAFHAWSFNFRGAGAGQQGGPGPTRNYFSFYQDADAYNIERIEFDRGPNSILFGLGTVGGTLSTYTKIPRRDKDFVTPQITFDSHGSARFEVDINQRPSSVLALRVNALLDDNKGWRNNDLNDRRALDIALLYTPTPKTSLRIEGEIASVKKTLISTTIADKSSGWDGVTSSETFGAMPTGTARTEHIQLAGSWGDWLKPYWVYAPQFSGDRSLMGWDGGWASTTSLATSTSPLNYQPYKGWYPDEIRLLSETTYSSTAAIPVLPSRDWTYGHGLSDTNYRNLTIFFDQKFTESLDLSLSFYRYEDDQSAKDYEGTAGAAIDINRQLPDGSPNPNYGKAFADFFLSKQHQSRTATEARAQLNYRFDTEIFGIPWKQLFSVSTSMKDLKISARQYLGQVDIPFSNPADWAQNVVWGRLYLDNPNQLMNAPTDVINGRRILYLPKADGYWFDFDDTFKLRDVAFMSHSRFFNDKLSILAGARQDRYKENLRELRRGPDLTDNLAYESHRGTTYSAGAVYYFHWLGVFVNYSENFQPPNPGSQPLLSGQRPDPETGEGLEYGLRVSTGDGKYYATLSRYDTKSKGRLVENPVGFRAVWDRFYNEQPDLPRDTTRTGLSYSDTTSLDVTGYEFEVTANPTESIRLQASFGKPDARVVDYYPQSRAYFAAHEATWAAVNSPVVATEVANVRDKLNQSTPGTLQQGLVDYTASLFVNYTFLGDTWKGFSIGGGASRIGRTYAATYDGQRYYGSSVTTTSLVLAYETRLGRFPARIALNVDNVLDEDDPIVTSYHSQYVDRSGTHIRENYSLLAPRTYRLSMRLSF